MKKFKVLVDCCCEGYLLAMSKSPCKVWTDKELNKGDIVNFEGEFVNYFGRFYTVEKDGVTYDILPKNLMEIIPHES